MKTFLTTVTKTDTKIFQNYKKRVFYERYHWPISLMSRVFANGPGDWSQVKSYQRLKKMVLDATLLSTQHYKVRIKGKVEQSWEWSSALL